MNRVLKGLIVAAICLACLVVSNVARGQVVYGNRTYTAPVCNNPNCSMCNAIRAGLQQQQRSSWSYSWQTSTQTVPTTRTVTGYRRVCINGVCSYQPIYGTVTESATVTTKPSTDAGQAPSTQKQIDAMLALLNLQPSDTFADIGCGDGRVCIAAVEQYGCRAIGVEIDPKKAADARRAVLLAVSEHRIPAGRIEVHTGDAAEWVAPRIDAASVYLWPDTLEELAPMLATIPRVVSLNHPIPGLEAVKERDGVYLYENKPAPVAVTVPPVQPRTRRFGRLQIVE